MFNLTEERKNEIKADEIFRHEVKTGLENTKQLSKYQKIFKFLNEPFVLWVLSSIVITGITLLYSHVSASIAEEKEKTTAIEKLENQIGVRFEFFRAISEKSSEIDHYKKALDTLLRDNPDIRLYPEFKHRSTLSLLWDLESRTKQAGGSGLHEHEVMSKLAELTELMAEIERENLSLEKREEIIKKLKDSIAHL